MRNSTKCAIAFGFFTAMTGGLMMIPMAGVGLILTYALRQRENSESPEALTQDFLEMYNNNPVIRKHVNRIMDGSAPKEEQDKPQK